ncbi:RNA polymerase [Dokdonia pacifica]|uniref:RNA polymerase sigma factor n=1 Tax=Dokdonia pacifica TaxID=1627892 RepID=A0A239B9I2_9FLAO|nr:sigma-70 family RNA polymerase sigma factor [Dokdonia pacifica]GGG30534.1 RNA polymerase [Dokdonia pacifica]SNS04635.1 RNA polymerase sigma-70 factor, ECF subfamily [Dokdonia pacifica]
MKPFIEQHIVELLKAQDERAIGLLYDHYADALFGVAIKVTKDEVLAQDVLQESFVKIWKNAHKYDSSKARLFTWLFRVVQNTAIDAVRSRQRKTTKEIQIEESNVYSIPSTKFAIEHLDIASHADGLEDKYRVVIDALFFQGMTQQEASDELNIPLGTVKSRLKIGLRELRKLFGIVIVFLSI